MSISLGILSVLGKGIFSVQEKETGGLRNFCVLGNGVGFSGLKYGSISSIIFLTLASFMFGGLLYGVRFLGLYGLGFKALGNVSTNFFLEGEKISLDLGTSVSKIGYLLTICLALTSFFCRGFNDGKSGIRDIFINII